jgi:hypothetical protein
LIRLPHRDHHDVAASLIGHIGLDRGDQYRAMFL